MQSSTPYPPEDSGSTKRRPIFGGRSGGSGSSGTFDPRLEKALGEYARVLEERLDDGLRAIQASASTLMREIASEMWRTSGGDAGDTQERILEFVSRDQAVRGMIAHSDERFQALAMRTERLEDSLREIAESNQRLKELIGRTAEALTEVAHSPALGSIDAVRRQLEQVEQHVAATMNYITERDKALLEAMEEQVRENGATVVHETGRVVEALQSYVQDGVDTMGRLAQRIEQHMQSAAARDEGLTELIQERIAATLGEQIQLLYERLGIEARTLADTFAAHETWLSRTFEASNGFVQEELGAQAETIRESAHLAASEINHLLEARVMGLAQLVRSDSEALRRSLVETAAAQDEAISRVIDERLIRVQETLDAANRWTVDEATRRIGEATEGALDGRVEQITLALDRNLIVLKDKIDEERRTVSELAAEAVTQGLDQRIGALARMIRSDNKILAERMQQVVEQDHARQTLRAVKELEASLGNEVMTTLDRKFSILADQLHRETQGMAESFAKSADVLSRKIDRIAEEQRSGPGDDEMQTAIERMGDAMHALAALNRRPSAGGGSSGGEHRIELD